MKSSLLISRTSICLLILVGCSNASKKTPADIPPPPQNLSKVESATPQINKNYPRSLQHFESQGSDYQPFSKVNEIRSNGGGVSEIKINNRGDLPSYYLYPNQQPEQNINNQQRNISTPTWQLNW